MTRLLHFLPAITTCSLIPLILIFRKQAKQNRQWRMYNGVSAFFHVYAPVCYPQTYTQTMWFGLQYATSPSNCTLQLCAVGSAFGGTCTALLPITNTGFNPYIWNFTTTSSTWSSSRWLLSGTLNCPAGGPVNGNYAYLNYFVTAGMEIQPGYPS